MPAALERMVSHMKRFSKVYITLDIDCLDPAYAAGTGTPQFGGLTARQLLDLLKGLFDGLNIIGMDVVEVAPRLDPLWRRCSRPGKLLPSAGPTTTSKTSPVRKQREEDQAHKTRPPVQAEAVFYALRKTFQTVHPSNV